jgi:hypothetical protein
VDIKTVRRVPRYTTFYSCLTDAFLWPFQLNQQVRTIRVPREVKWEDDDARESFTLNDVQTAAYDLFGELGLGRLTDGLVVMKLLSARWPGLPRDYQVVFIEGADEGPLKNPFTAGHEEEVRKEIERESKDERAEAVFERRREADKDREVPLTPIPELEKGRPSCSEGRPWRAVEPR